MQDEDTRGPELLDELTSGTPVGDALASVLDALPDGILVVDFEGLIRHASGPLQELSGYARDELVGEPVEILIPKEIRRIHIGRRERFAEDPQVRSMGAGMAINLRHRSGELVPVDISLSPIQVSGTSFVVAAVRHAGPRREAEDMLRHALRREREVSVRLRQLDQLKDSFLRAVSHDLRSPLATMIGSASTVMERLDQLDRETTVRLLDSVIRGGERLETLLSDLLDLDRMNRGAVSAERQVIDVARLVREEVAALDPDGARVEVVAPPEMPWAVDPSQLGRILVNLVENAWKHAPGDDPVLVRLERDGDDLVLSVEDRGPGVADHAKRSICELFVRGESEAEGTGIGLSLVGEFARLHDGRAWVEDRPGGGSSFRVSFPSAGSEER